MQFVDSHAHLTDEAFALDLDAVLERAEQAGVVRILTLGTDIATSRAAIVLAEKHEGIFAAVGVHPEAVKQVKPGDLEIIRDLASHPKVVAVGEIGLDYYWDKASADLQRWFLKKQLELAVELNLPVSIHDRDAHLDILEALSLLDDRKVSGVLHSFSGDGVMMGNAVAMGFMISFAGPITFRNAKKAAELVPLAPVDKVLIETDCPYLSPHPLRGRRNEPANVVRVAERIAELTSSSPEQVAAATTRTARSLFHF